MYSISPLPSSGYGLFLKRASDQVSIWLTLPLGTGGDREDARDLLEVLVVAVEIGVDARRVHDERRCLDW
jgi:hypothetical protein